MGSVHLVYQFSSATAAGADVATTYNKWKTCACTYEVWFDKQSTHINHPDLIKTHLTEICQINWCMFYIND